MMFLFLIGCGTQPIASPVHPTPTPPPLWSGLSSYSGGILPDELTTLQKDAGEDQVYTAIEVVNDEIDVDSLAPFVIVQSDDQVVFQCDIQHHTGTRIGAINRYRVCVVNNGHPTGSVVAYNIYRGLASQDSHWLALIGDTDNDLLQCQHQIYITDMSVDNLIPLIDPTEFAHGLRLCGVQVVAWMTEGHRHYITFRSWDGSETQDHYDYQIAFVDPVDPAPLQRLGPASE
ncbi:MAG: hypothetical protein AAF125_20015 [Chloroflexota bacterium]